jgi:hypothetical protein
MKSDRHFGLVNRGHRGLEGNTVCRTDISGLVIAPNHVTFFRHLCEIILWENDKCFTVAEQDFYKHAETTTEYVVML